MSGSLTTPGAPPPPPLDTAAEDLDDPLSTGPLPEPADTRSGVRTTTAGALWHRFRAPIIIGLLLLLTVIGTTVFRQRAGSGSLDPTSASPAGSRALAVLLGERGVTVDRVRGLPDGGEAGTVFVPFAGELPAAALDDLSDPPTGTHIVLVAPEVPLTVLGVEIKPKSTVSGRVLDPGCDLPLAQAAGPADVGGSRYSTGTIADSATIVHTCFEIGSSASLVRVERDGASVTVIGSATAFTNARLDEEGNAALAFGLLDQEGPLRWVMRRAVGTAPPQERKSLGELLPDGVKWGALQLLIAAGVAMLWRGRRLGPVVVEPLPVVVRAAEAVEGRGRLYAAAKARGRAGWLLRRSAQGKLRTRLGLPADASNEVLVDAAAVRTARNPNEIGRLLYGPDPVDDEGLVRLAADLDYLHSEVRRS